MTTTIKRRKIIITKIVVQGDDRFIPIEIRLPANVKKVMGIMVTATETWNGSD